MQCKENYPKIGIRPVIDGRRKGIRESLEETTMNMARNVAGFYSRHLQYPDGSPVACVISDTCIGGVKEAAECVLSLLVLFNGYILAGWDYFLQRFYLPSPTRVYNKIQSIKQISLRQISLEFAVFGRKYMPSGIKDLHPYFPKASFVVYADTYILMYIGKDEKCAANCTKASINGGNAVANCTKVSTNGEKAPANCVRVSTIGESVATKCGTVSTNIERLLQIAGRFSQTIDEPLQIVWPFTNEIYTVNNYNHM
jgi:hypothetical protein